MNYIEPTNIDRLLGIRLITRPVPHHMVRAKTHRRARIDKKWLKRYGYKSVVAHHDPFEVLVLGSNAYAYPEGIEAIKAAMDKANREAIGRDEERLMSGLAASLAPKPPATDQPTPDQPAGPTKLFGYPVVWTSAEIEPALGLHPHAFGIRPRPYLPILSEPVQTAANPAPPVTIEELKKTVDELLEQFPGMAEPSFDPWTVSPLVLEPTKPPKLSALLPPLDKLT